MFSLFRDFVMESLAALKTVLTTACHGSENRHELGVGRRRFGVFFFEQVVHSCFNCRMIVMGKYIESFFLYGKENP